MNIKCIIKEFPPKSVISQIVLPLAEKMVQDMAYYPLWCVMLVLHWCLGLGHDLSFNSVTSNIYYNLRVFPKSL